MAEEENTNRNYIVWCDILDRWDSTQFLILESISTNAKTSTHKYTRPIWKYKITKPMKQLSMSAKEMTFSWHLYATHRFWKCFNDGFKVCSCTTNVSLPLIFSPVSCWQKLILIEQTSAGFFFPLDMLHHLNWDSQSMENSIDNKQQMRTAWRTEENKTNE